MDRSLIETQLHDLFCHQLFGVLATAGSAGPYTSLVAFAVSEDLRRLVFVTGSSTRKYENILADASVALLVDDRSNNAVDIQGATAVTAVGSAHECQEALKDRLLTPFLAKHPHLQAFVQEPSTVLMEIHVARYILVSKFQNVQVLEMPSSP